MQKLIHKLMNIYNIFYFSCIDKYNQSKLYKLSTDFIVKDKFTGLSLVFMTSSDIVTLLIHTYKN